MYINCWYSLHSENSTKVTDSSSNFEHEFSVYSEYPFGIELPSTDFSIWFCYVFKNPSVEK